MIILFDKEQAYTFTANALKGRYKDSIQIQSLEDLDKVQDLDKAKVIVHTSRQTAKQAYRHPDAYHIMLYKKNPFTKEELANNSLNASVSESDLKELINNIENGINYTGFSSQPAIDQVKPMTIPPQVPVKIQAIPFEVIQNTVCKFLLEKEGLSKETCRKMTAKEFEGDVKGVSRSYVDQAYDYAVAYKKEHKKDLLAFDGFEPKPVEGHVFINVINRSASTQIQKEHSSLQKEEIKERDMPSQEQGRVEVKDDSQTLSELRAYKSLAATSDNKLQVNGYVNNHIVGLSPAITNLLYSLEKVSKRKSVDVLILGENGTGKELVIKTLLENSASKNNLVINAAAESDQLFISNMMGYKKGAFTGADADKRGYLQACQGGKLVIDELAELSKTKQASILRVLQNREGLMVGDTKPYPFTGQFYFATNQNLEAMVKDGTMREDFYNRINNFVVVIPPLRERKEDIPLLAGHFLEKFNALEGEQKTFAPEALQYLMKFEWPGNVRELEKTITRALIYSEQDIIATKDIENAIASVEFKPSQNVPRNIDVLKNLEQGQAQKPEPVYEVLDQQERQQVKSGQKY